MRRPVEPANAVIPRVVEATNQGERIYDIYSRLLQDSITYVGVPIDDSVANLTIAQLLFLEAETPERDIWLYVNSPGGSITASLAIYDTMQFVRLDITTVCVGQAASMAALLMAAGARGKRFGLPNSRFVLHQPSTAGLGGEATDIDIHAREILRMRQEITRVLAHHTGQLPETISKDIERDYILTPQQAKEYGLIDDIIYKKHVP